jgi:peptidoglycan/xylan/chitin deacetylase (PgdA/CDA1 family)
MNFTVKKHISLAVSLLQLGRLMDRMNRKKGGCILVYHDISSQSLEAQLSLFSRWYTFVPLQEFVRRHTQGRSTVGLMAITFDDGLANEIEDGASLAVRRGWPMTFYLPTRFVVTGRPYWFLELGPMLQSAPRGHYQWGQLSFTLGDRDSRERARKQLVRYLLCRPTPEIDDLLEHLREDLLGAGPEAARIPVPRPITPQRVAKLARRGLVDFQPHSRGHHFLCTLTEEEIREEMTESRRDVEDMTGTPAEHFCYPYGQERAIGPLAPRVARSLFRSAVTSINARCHPGQDEYMLPRITMHEHYTLPMAGLKVQVAR